MAAVAPASQPLKADLSIPKHFANLKDPRRAHRRLHYLQDIIVIAMCAVIANAQDWQETETFGRKRYDWLRGFLELPNGIPSHDTFERVFNARPGWVNSSLRRPWCLQAANLAGKLIFASRFKNDRRPAKYR